MAKSKKLVFNVEKYLETAGLARKVLEYRKRQTIFAQGSACKSVLYLQRGRVKLTVTSARVERKLPLVLALPVPIFVKTRCVAKLRTVNLVMREVIRSVKGHALR